MNAKALLRRKGVLTLGQLAEAIAGEPIRGSWWAHPKGKLIFNVATKLEDDPDVLACKLLGKAVFVHEALWPALYRVVTDPSRTANAKKKLSPAAAAFVRRARKPTRVTRETLAPRDKAALEKSCILHVSSEHTEDGTHATVMRSWASWATDDVKRAAAELPFDAAHEALAIRGFEL